MEGSLSGMVKPTLADLGKKENYESGANVANGFAPSSGADDDKKEANRPYESQKKGGF